MCISLPVGIIIQTPKMISALRITAGRLQFLHSFVRFISDLEYLEYSGNKDFKSDGDEDDTAEDRGLIGELRSEFLTDYQSGNADKEGDRCNDEGCGQCHGETIFCNGKSNR